MILLEPLYLNFLFGANFTYAAKAWHYDAHTKDAMQIIKRETEITGDSATISNHWLFEPTINFYITTWKLNMKPTNRNGIDLNTDFIYRLEEYEKPGNFIVLSEYHDIKSDLLMNTK